MKRWGVIALAGMTVALAALTVGSALLYVVPVTTPLDDVLASTGGGYVATDSYVAMMQTAYAFYSLVPWLTTATLLAGIAALALAARRAQLAGSASATAARVASSD